MICEVNVIVSVFVFTEAKRIPLMSDINLLLNKYGNRCLKNKYIEKLTCAQPHPCPPSRPTPRRSQMRRGRRLPRPGRLV